MDLPTCPACGQSVLDDDTDECPFCGASMSGKPGAGGAAVKQAPQQPAARPAGKSSAAAEKGPTAGARSGQTAASRSSVKAKAEPGEDDPFGSEGASSVKAIQLLPAPRKGRQWEVICPMCETPGYTATRASGREVRCANPACMVPVFTAPEYEPPAAPQAPEPEKARWPIVAGVTLAGIALVAAVGYFTLFYNSEEIRKDLDKPFVRNVPTPQDDPENPGDPGNPGGNPAPERNPLDPPDSRPTAGNGGQTPRASDVPAAEELPEKLMSQLIEESQRAPQSQKAASRRLVAEAYAQLGQLDNAREQLAQLDKVRRNSLEFYRIPPLTQIAWQQLQAEDAAAAKQSLDEALQAADQLESFGRVPLDYATVLSGALVAAGRADEARTLIRQHHDDGFLGRFSAELQIAWASGRFNLDQPSGLDTLVALRSPQRAAVTVAAAAKGDAAKALDWARQADDADGRLEALALWAEMQAGLYSKIPLPAPPAENKQKNSSSSARKPDSEEPAPDPSRRLVALLDSAAADLGTEDAAAVYSRAAARLANDDRPTVAAEILQKATARTEKLTSPAELALPPLKELHRRYELKDPGPLRRAAIVHAEVARAQALLGQSEAAWKSLQLALAFTRGMAPSPAATGEYSRQIARSPQAMQEQLADALDLTSADQKRTEFINFRSKVGGLEQATAERTQLQSQLLAAAVRWGLAEQVWEELRARTGHSETVSRENWAGSLVALQTADALKAAGKSELVEAGSDLTEGAEQQLSDRDRLKLETDRLVASGNAAAAMQKLEQSTSRDIDRMWKARRILQLGGRLAAGDTPELALLFINSTGDPLVRVDSFELVAAQLARHQVIEPLWKLLQDRKKMTASEKAAIGNGLIAGMNSPVIQEPAVPPAAPAAEVSVERPAAAE